MGTEVAVKCNTDREASSRRKEKVKQNGSRIDSALVNVAFNEKEQ